MIELSRKKFDGEMKLTVTRAPTQETIKELRRELGLVKNIVDYWKEKSDKRAFGKIKNENISFENWREIYSQHGWIEISDYHCFYNPKNISIEKCWFETTSNSSSVLIVNCQNKINT